MMTDMESSMQLLHLVFNVDGLNVQSAGTAIAAGRWGRGSSD